MHSNNANYIIRICVYVCVCVLIFILFVLIIKIQYKIVTALYVIMCDVTYVQKIHMRDDYSLLHLS